MELFLPFAFYGVMGLAVASIIAAIFFIVRY